MVGPIRGASAENGFRYGIFFWLCCHLLARASMESLSGRARIGDVWYSDGRSIGPVRWWCIAWFLTHQVLERICSCSIAADSTLAGECA